MVLENFRGAVTVSDCDMEIVTVAVALDVLVSDSAGDILLVGFNIETVSNQPDRVNETNQEDHDEQKFN